MDTFRTRLSRFFALRFYAGLLLIGLLFTVISIVILVTPQEETVETDAEILSISEETVYNESDGTAGTAYTATVRYEVDGTEYEGQIACGTSEKEGGTMRVAYRPSSPGEIMSPGMEWFPYLMLAIGVIAIAFALIKGLKEIKEPASSQNQMDKVDLNAVDPAAREAVLNDNEPMVEYYFHFCKKLNQSYVLETPTRRAIYEANCERIGVFRPYLYDFVDCRTHQSSRRVVTHTSTSRFGNGSAGPGSVSIVHRSSFKIDEEVVWDILAKNGYSLETHINGIKVNFDVFHYGVKVAELEAAGSNILKDDAGSKLGDKLPGNGLYKVRCKDSDIENVFLAAFAVSRVELF